MTTYIEEFECISAEHRRLLKQEEFLLDVANALAATLQNEGITKSELAKRLGKTKGFVSQILSGGRNLTLRTIADVADALAAKPCFSIQELRPCRPRRMYRAAKGEYQREVLLLSEHPRYRPVHDWGCLQVADSERPRAPVNERALAG